MRFFPKTTTKTCFHAILSSNLNHKSGCFFHVQMNGEKSPCFVANQDALEVDTL